MATGRMKVLSLEVWRMDRLDSGMLQKSSLVLQSTPYASFNKILMDRSVESLIELKIAHQGGVKGLQVNPFQPYLVASGAINSDILLWDLNSLQSYPPSQSKSLRMEDVTDLAWNCQVPHILATSSNNGYTIIWDLKNRKEAIQLCLPGGRKSVSSIAWNPDNPTHILTASDDDSSPVIYSWDLRNAHAPNMTLSGHTKGILSMSWCPKDSELLLSSGKDCKTLCWNPKNGALVNEVSHSSNWIFDTQWCPRNPDIFSSASFDGKVMINSYQALSAGQGTKPTATNDLFSTSHPVSQSSVDKSASAVRQIPKWLRRPIGASFGFGGRLVSFSENSAKRLTVSSIPSFDGNASKLLDEALRMDSLGNFCQNKINRKVNNLHEKDPEAVFWNVVKVLVEQEPQKNLMNLLGFDKEKFDKQVKGLKLQDISESFGDLSLNNQENPEETSSDASPIQFEGGSGENIFEQIASTTSVSQKTPRPSISATFSLFGPESSETDRVITQAIIMGDFDTAVDICLRSNRLSDALLVSICGGPELVARTQEIYLQRVKFPYLRVVSAIIKKDLSDVVGSADVSNWEELLGLVCSFAQAEQFGQLCSTLANRLANHEGMLLPSIICHMAAGNKKEAASGVLKMELPKAPLKGCEQFSYDKYASWLEGLIEKIRGVERASVVFRQSGNQVNLQSELPEIAVKYLEYAILMADEGHLDIAARYFGLPSNVGESELVKSFGDRLYRAVQTLGTGMAQVPAPFTPVNISPEGGQAMPSSAPTNQAAGWNQPQPQPGSGHIRTGPSFTPPLQGAPGSFQPNTAANLQPFHGGQFQGPTSVPGGFPPAPTAPAPFQPSGNMPGPFPPAAVFSSAPAPFPPAPSGPTASFAPMNSNSPFPPGNTFQSPMNQFNPQPPTGPFPPPTAAAPFPPHPSASVSQQPPMGSMGSMGFSQQPQFPPTGPSAAAVPAPTGPSFPPAQTAFPSSQPTPFGQSAQQFSPTDMTGFPGQNFNPPQPTASTAPGFMPRQYGSMSGSGSAGTVPVAAPSVPAPPPIMSPTGIPAPSLESIRKPVGGFNDAPMVSPKQPLAPSSAFPANPPFNQQPIAPFNPTSMTSPPGVAPQFQAAPPQQPSFPQQQQQQPQQPQQQAPSASTSPKAQQLGPVDPARIPPNSQQIYQTFQSLIQFCQQRALPVQRRVVEDSVKRLQFLFHQLANSDLSGHVHAELLRVCPLIQQRQYEAAIEWHVPLMTAHFAEVGQWILAIKRLLDVAKACPQ